MQETSAAGPRRAPTPAIGSTIRDTEESLPRRDLERLQLERLQAGIKRLSTTVPFYRDKLSGGGGIPERIRSLDDLVRLPFTTKYDLRDNYPFGLLAVPMKQVTRIHASSGTTGKPTVVAYTQNDIALWAELIARAYAAAGVTEHDIIHNAYGYGLFTGGLGFHYGAERIGATVIPVSGGNTKRQVTLLRDCGSTVLCCTPSYALLIAEVAEEEGIEPASLPLKVGMFGAEPWSERMRQEIESRLGIVAHNMYGLSEVIGPGVAFECRERQGMHVFEDHFIPEIIDPETTELLPEGEVGELVLTCVTKEALPLLRYRTRDRTRLMREPCACGRTTVRIDRLVGRTDDMIIVRGVNVFPSQVEAVLLRDGEVTPHYQIIVDRTAEHMDELDVLVEAPAEIYANRDRLVQHEKRLSHEVRSALGISCNVKLVGPRQIARSEGKAVRVVDRRRL
jgi:phenylacetate-CoA ligase